MLQFFRSGLSKYFVTVLFIILIASFVLWGGAGDIFNKSTSQVAIIGERTVSPTDYLRAFNNRMSALTQQYGDNITKELAIKSGIDQMIEKDLISSESLNEAAHNLGLRVTDQQLLTYIKDIPGFKDQFGSIDSNNFQQVANARGMSKSQLENVIREEIVRIELIKTLTDGIKTPETFQNIFYQLGKEKRTATLIKINIANIAEIPAISEEDLKSYYDIHADNYMSPEYRTFNYIRLQKDDFISEAVVTKEEIQQFYDERIAEYTKEEKRSVNVMMIDKKEAAEKAYNELQAGGDFDTINLKYTETTGEESLVENQLRKDTDEIYGQAATDFIFNGALQQNSTLINTDFGYRIFKISAITPGEITPLEDVSITLEIELKSAKASEILYEKSNKIESEIADGNSVEEIATSLNVPIRTITSTTQFGYNKQNRSITNMPAIEEFLKNAFDVMPGDDPELYSTDDEQFYLISMTDIEDEQLRPLEEVKSEISGSMAYAARTKEAIKISEAITGSLNNGEKIDDVMAQYPSLNSEIITAVRAENPDSLDNNIHQSIFTQKIGEAATVQTISQASYIVINVISAEKSKDAPDAQTRIAIANALDQKYKSEALSTYQTYLNKTLPVQVNQAVIDQVLKQILDKEE